jgi:hypothetical protein
VLGKYQLGKEWINRRSIIFRQVKYIEGELAEISPDSREAKCAAPLPKSKIRSMMKINVRQIWSMMKIHVRVDLNH